MENDPITATDATGLYLDECAGKEENTPCSHCAEKAQNAGRLDNMWSTSTFDPTVGMPDALKASYESYEAMVTDAFVDRAAQGFKITSTLTFDDGTSSEHSSEGQFAQTKTDLLSLVHTGLDVAGLTPGVGAVADGVNGAIYLAQGDWGNAALSVASMIPIAGNAFGGARIARRFASHEGALIDLAKQFKRKGLNAQEVDIRKDWAKEYGVYFRGPESHPGRTFTIPHVHIGPIDHIPVRP